ncbi:uncharacterized protein LOC143226255 [Tachypleus tridentatus]|uniref:uncharacterized protein LOC143226255 n=1 Tax=Tachypleus tridentatus TaxID=6853 RepID=UPI003FD228C0
MGYRTVAMVYLVGFLFITNITLQHSESPEFTENGDKKNSVSNSLVGITLSVRKARLVQADRKTTITILYSNDVQKHIGLHQQEATPGFTLVSLEQEDEATGDHQNWMIEDWKNVVWTDESRFLLRHAHWEAHINRQLQYS